LIQKLLIQITTFHALVDSNGNQSSFTQQCAEAGGME
tara:strand:- start:319 stop:429 length:111 start_codon:yes stop_codon:yes gene_type:complete